MTQRDLLALIDKYLDGTATEEEKGLLQQYYDSFAQTNNWREEELGNQAETEQRILEGLVSRLRNQSERTIPLHHRNWVKVAAVFFLLFLGTWWFFKAEEKTLSAALPSTKKQKISEGKHTTLTLANGTVVVLDDQPDGPLTGAKNIRIGKEAKSITIAAPQKKEEDVTGGYHTLKTPKGQQYKAVLEDGSRVWLNTASSLRIPAVFADNERRVEVTGEAYFEVVKDATRPFRVFALSQEGSDERSTIVEVLGTHFNINAYADEEQTKTTLLEGSVKVGRVNSGPPKNSDVAILLPGEQAQVSTRKRGTLPVTVKNADAAEVLAWTSNVFHFNNTDLQNIMRQLARWYDVEVVYVSKVPPRNFSGKISRTAPLATVLEILEQSNIRFTIKGNQIIVRS